MKKVKSINILFLLKTGIGSAVAIILAESLGFAFSPSAGIITLLTIHNTKKETLTIARGRMIAFILAIVISYLVFNNFGYTAVAFGGFVFLFVALCNLFGLKDGISVNAVLMTHFLIEGRMDLSLLLNETALLLIGMGIGILLNLIMPRNLDKIRNEQNYLEEEIKKTLRGMANVLKEKQACLIQDTEEANFINREENKSDKQNDSNKKYNADKEYNDNKEIDYLRVDFVKLDTMLISLLKKAYEEAGNTLLSDTKYFVSYLEMRKLQVGVLKDINKNIEHIPVLLRQTYPIANFMENISDSFHELNNVEGLYAELEDLQEYYRKDTLPTTREEFEYRATLFQILQELEYFLLLKRNFIHELETKNMKFYWARQNSK